MGETVSSQLKQVGVLHHHVVAQSPGEAPDSHWRLYEQKINLRGIKPLRFQDSFITLSNTFANRAQERGSHYKTKVFHFNDI